jgi:glycosyltransferase involved in cell wall biosynthesis
VKFGAGALHRAYFIQDFEPYFFGHGAQYEFAAMTYRLPFRRIVLGEMLDGMIREATGLGSDVIPFGCDSDVYRLPAEQGRRSGIVFYSRRDDSRRGYELACVTLAEFHRAHPDQEIHVYGEPPRGLEVPHTFHGWIPAADLNELYGRTIAGLALSFTNITLVAEEMLAAGNIPVVNEVPLAHRVLQSPFVRWADPTADSLAAALGEAVSSAEIEERAAAAAASVSDRSWGPTYDALADILERQAYGRDRADV